MPDKRTETDKKSPRPITSSKGQSARGKNQHVVQREHGWVVLGENNSQREIIHSETQSEAIRKAREIAMNQRSEVVIHGRDGRIIGREVLTDKDWELVADPEDTAVKFVDFQYYGKRPHIRGRRLLISMVARNDQADQWHITELAHDFSITEEEVLAALLYYREHKDEIDQQDAEEQKLFDEMYEHHGKIGKP